MMEAAKTNQFHGLSTLRVQERVKQPKTEQAKALEAYLKKYTGGGDSGLEPKKKKRKKQPTALPQGVRIIDEDNTGFIAPQAQRSLPKSALDVEDTGLEDEEDAPVIANPGEAELYARLRDKEVSGAAFQNWVSAETEAPRQQGKHNASGSPPARPQRHDSPDASPPRRQRHDSPDASPARRQQRHDSPNASPPRRQRHDRPDASPVRRQQRHDSPDASPPRRRQTRGSPDASPQPAGDTAGGVDASPPRRRRADSPDASPPRRQPGKDKSKTMHDGTSAGMVSGKALAAEMEKQRAAEKRRFAKLEAATGSRHAETVYRDKETGRQMTREEFEAAQQAATEKKKPQYEAPEWGGGVRQMKEREEKAEALRRVASKPFARSLADVDTELNLRDRARFGDPMAHLVKQQPNAPPPPAIPAHMEREMQKSGFVVPQDVPPHSWLNRRMGPPPNRYGIRPGRHWDGVNRSTGFEDDMFKQQAARAAYEQEARMWSQADM